MRDNRVKPAADRNAMGARDGAHQYRRRQPVTLRQNAPPRSLRGAAGVRTHAREAVTIPPPVPIKFPEVVAAVRVVEERPWKIGDALIKECGRPGGEHGVNTGVYAKIRQCSHELRRLNLKGYCFDHLRELWRTAANFPDGERSPSVDFSLYSEAGDPGTLKLAMEAADRKGIGITVKYIKHFKKLRGREKSTSKTDKAPRR